MPRTTGCIHVRRITAASSHDAVAPREQHESMREGSGTLPRRYSDRDQFVARLCVGGGTGVDGNQTPPLNVRVTSFETPLLSMTVRYTSVVP